MAIRYYQSGDYEATVLRKCLENLSQVMAGNQTMSTVAGVATGTPRFYAQGDSKNDLLRKILENRSQVMAGNLTLNTV